MGDNELHGWSTPAPIFPYYGMIYPGAKQESEPKFRINLKQSAKGECYFDVTVRGETKEEASKLLDEAVEIAVKKIASLKVSVTETTTLPPE